MELSFKEILSEVVALCGAYDDTSGGRGFTLSSNGLQRDPKQAYHYSVECSTNIRKAQACFYGI